MPSSTSATCPASTGQSTDLLIGAHVSVAGGVSLAFERAEAIQARSFQIFTRSARTWTSKPLFEQERRAFRDGARRTGLPSIAHGSYLTNLGASEPQLWEKSVSSVIEELTRCERLGVEPRAHCNSPISFTNMSRGDRRTGKLPRLALRAPGGDSGKGPPERSARRLFGYLPPVRRGL